MPDIIPDIPIWMTWILIPVVSMIATKTAYHWIYGVDLDDWSVLKDGSFMATVTFGILVGFFYIT